MTVDQSTVLRDRLSSVADRPLVCPGVTDGLAARLAAELGFGGIYVSGAGCSAARGLPDMGLLSLSELLDAVHVLSVASGLPAIVDGDTGYGDSAGIRRTMRELAAAGAAGVHLEDQPVPRKCGYLTSEPCVPIPEMLRRLDAAQAADSGLVLIARTDALLTEGIDRTVERALAYCKAGVDLLMINGVSTYEELERVQDACGFPMLHNVSGSDRTPAFTPEQYQRLDVRVVIYPIQTARAAALAARNHLLALRQHTTPPPLMPFSAYMNLAGWQETERFEDEIARRNAARSGREAGA